MTPSAGLSLDQAPPIAGPLRFFLSAPVFGVLAAAALAWQGEGALTFRWLPGTLAAAHLVALGVLTMVMCGAMLQMLPVVAGAPVARPRLVAAVVHGLLTTGTLALATGFLAGWAPAFRVAVVLLGAAVTVFLAATIHALVRARSAWTTVGGLWLAAISLAVTAILGVTLAAGYGWTPSALFAPFRDRHPAWGLAGWVGLLVIGVAFQVVPMFQLTPPYPAAVQRALPATAFVLLALASVLPGPGPARAAAILLALAFVAFAAVTVWVQARRRRRVADVTLAAWRVAVAALALAATGWIALPAAPAAAFPRAELAVGVLFVGGFATTIVCGMLQRIVPFLAWFHLQAKAGIGVRVPHVRELLKDRAVRRQLLAHVVAVVLLAGATAVPSLLVVGAAAWALAQALLGWNLLGAAWRYRVAARAIAARQTAPPAT